MDCMPCSSTVSCLILRADAARRRSEASLSAARSSCACHVSPGSVLVCSMVAAHGSHMGMGPCIMFWKCCCSCSAATRQCWTIDQLIRRWRPHLCGCCLLARSLCLLGGQCCLHCLHAPVSADIDAAAGQQALHMQDVSRAAQAASAAGHNASSRPRAQR